MRNTAPLFFVFFVWLACQRQSDSTGDIALDLPLQHAPPVAPEEKLSAELRRALEEGASEEKRRLLVDLTPQLDLHALGERLSKQELRKAQRRQAVTAALRRVAEVSQARFQPVLEELRVRGWVESYRGFSIVNRLVVVATPRGVRALAERDEVAAITEETTTKVPALAAAGRAPAPYGGENSWALATVGADSAWQRGLDGAGVVVGIIDAGASAAHEQLRGNYRGGDRAWHDPSGDAVSPEDGIRGHGTQILSAAVGQNLEGKALGVAPGAQWVACGGLPEGRYSNVALTDCADWILNTGQPDVLVNAWLLPGEGCDESAARIVDAWRAAEIFPVFAAGNYGPQARTDRSPANYVGLYPGDGVAFSVGGLAAPESAFARSSRGPNSCDGFIFPTVVAPARDVTAAFPLTTSTYIQSEGTSVAAGLTAGAAAILLQRYPEATVSGLEEALRSSAIDLGPAGPDNTFGYGRIYIPAALDSLGRLLTKKLAAKRPSEPARQR